MANVLETFQKYMGTGLTIILFLAALLYLFICEKQKPYRILFVYTPILLLLLFFNPLFAFLFQSLLGAETYFRLFWIIPYLLVLSYSAVRIIEQMKGVRAVCATLAAVAVIVVSGKLVYSNPLYSRAENIYHMPESVVQICDAIEVPGREVMALFPDELLLYVRQYSPVVCMPYGRDVLMGYYNQLHVMTKTEVLDLEQIAPLSREAGCHYVVLRKDRETVGSTEDLGWEVFLETEDYVVYRDSFVPLEIPEGYED